MNLFGCSTTVNWCGQHPILSLLRDTGAPSHQLTVVEQNRKEIHAGFPFTRTDPSQMTSPHPLRSRHRDFGARVNTEGYEGASPLPGRRLRLQCPWDSGTAPEREARANDYVPSSSTPSMIDHIMPSQSAHFTVVTTRRQRMRCLSSLAWPPLL